MTPIHDGLLVLDLAGPGLPDLLCCSLPVPLPADADRTAVRFAEIDCIAYRMHEGDVRLHIDGTLAAHLSQWLVEALRAAFGEGGQRNGNVP